MQGFARAGALAGKALAMNDKIVSLASTGNVDWSVFLQEGIIIALTIKYYRGATTVDFSELGIDDEGDEKLRDFLNEYISPGTKNLIPPEIKGQLKSIETTARKNLTDHSFDCSAFSSTGKFVPKTMYMEWEEVNDELRNRFYDVRDEFADNYESIIDRVRKDYRVLASKLYMQSHPAAKRPSPKFVNAFVEKIVEQIASPDEILACFEFKTTMQVIPEYLLRVISQKNNIDEKVMRIAATNQPKSAPAKKKQEDPEFDEMQRDIEAKMKEQAAEQAADFLDNIQMSLRTEAADGAGSVIKSIDRNDGKLIGRASVQARSLVNGIRGKNFYGDAELEEHVAALDEALGEDAKTRDVAAVREAASNLLAWSQKSMKEIHSKTVERKVASAPDRKSRRSTSTSSAASSAKKTAKASTTKQTKKTAPKEKPKAKINVPKNTKRRTIKQRS